ncbi:hypothetical protein ACIRPR_27325 [Streptomyces griseoflavus]|uniref:hypothetical protein n=1 Tax=Streptomyces griseoflavus TaxID=35619 RepID=UPI0037F19646
MGTRTEDETETGTGTGTGAETERDETAVEATEADDVTEAESEAESVAESEADSEAEAGKAVPGAGENPSGVGQGAAAVVSAALGLVSLTGSWLGTVAAARETLVGQLEVAADAGVATQVKEMYGDAWNTSAVWSGLFALTALTVGAAVLARPAFGTPARAAQAPWIKSVAWAGVVLGVIGLLLAVLKYTGVLLGLPATG